MLSKDPEGYKYMIDSTFLVDRVPVKAVRISKKSVLMTSMILARGKAIWTIECGSSYLHCYKQLHFCLKTWQLIKILSPAFADTAFQFQCL